MTSKASPPSRTRPVLLWVGTSDPKDTGYRAHPDGLIYRQSKTGRWHPVRPWLKRGRPVVRLTIDGQPYDRSLAQLVCRAFHGPRPVGCSPYHYPDPDRANCRADNLRWAPRNAHRIGMAPQCQRPAAIRGEDNGSAVLTSRKVERIRALYRKGRSAAAIAERMGIGSTAVLRILRGASWSHVPDPLGSIVLRRPGAPVGNQNRRKAEITGD